MFTRSQIVRQLGERRASGEKLLGMSIGSGVFSRYAEMAEANLVLASNVSRFRQMGLSSLSGTMPFGNANQMVYDFATREILPQNQTIPVIFGLCAIDPLRPLISILDEIKQAGFSGVCNIPTVLLYDGEYRRILEASGFSYACEVQAIAAAHAKDLFTIGFVQNADQALAMHEAGADAIAVHFGAAKGGLLGAKTEETIHDAAAQAIEVYSALDKVNDLSFKLMYGGPAKTPASVRHLYELTNADGFIGGYTFERILMEKALKDSNLRELFVNTDRSKTAHEQTPDYVDFTMRYIEEHYAEAISTGQIASLLHISRPYFSSLFKKSTGTSFSEYLILHRLRRATDLLLHTRIPISQVAAKVGIPDNAHFSKTFKKRIGVSPYQYRKQYKNT